MRGTRFILVSSDFQVIQQTTSILNTPHLVLLSFPVICPLLISAHNTLTAPPQQSRMLHSHTVATKSAEQSLNVWEVQGENYWQTSWYIPASEESVLGAGAKPLITLYICDKYVLKKSHWTFIEPDFYFHC